MKIAFYTLGCKTNQFETQALETLFEQRGHTIVPFDEFANVYIVNTCTVTALSDKKSRNAARRCKKINPQATLIVCGCYSQMEPEQAREMCGADIVVGTGCKGQIVELAEQAQAEASFSGGSAVQEAREFEVLPAGGLRGRTRALLKVQDGCQNFCTYCIIPYARGPVRSLPLAEAARQAAELQEEGYREIVLTGIEISSWGRDLKDGTSLIDLVEAICAAAPGVRIRLGSLEPRTVTEDFCRRAAALPDLCPQFHLSLQSGCDETLRRMNRKYDTAQYAHSVALLNQYFDRPAITTDLICGFPEETEEEFSQTLRFIAACGFAQMHIFPYSVRPGTPAAEMPQIPKAVKEERCRRASETAAGMRRAYLEGCVGQVYPVLFEQPRDGKFFGHAPNYMEVLADGEGLHNQVRTVEITGTDGQALLGRILEG